MVSSPARCHYVAESARKAASRDNSIDLGSLTPYQKLLVQLKRDQRTLKAIQSIENKALAKADMLSSYAEWVSGIVDSGSPIVGDQITPTVLLWMIDAGRLDEAVDLALFALDTGIAATDDFARTLPTIIYEQFAEEMIKGRSLAVPALIALLERLDRKEDGRMLFDMPDKVRARFYKAAGGILEEVGEPSSALSQYEKALRFDDRCGVRQRIKTLGG